MKILTKIEIALLLGLALTLIFGDIKRTSDVRDKITDNVMRLHILANSDSDEDQSMKLKVRDKMLEICPELFDGRDINDASSIAQEKLEQIVNSASEIIKNEGKNYSVDAKITDMYFDERKYDNFTMPAGCYTALRIEIGEAKGRNWWCVMYPPLCLPAAEDEAYDYFTNDECDMLKNPRKYEIKFKILDIADKIKERSSNAGKSCYAPDPKSKSFVKKSSKLSNYKSSFNAK